MKRLLLCFFFLLTASSPSLMAAGFQSAPQWDCAYHASPRGKCIFGPACRNFHLGDTTPCRAQRDHEEKLAAKEEAHRRFLAAEEARFKEIEKLGNEWKWKERLKFRERMERETTAQLVEVSLVRAKGKNSENSENSLQPLRTIRELRVLQEQGEKLTEEELDRLKESGGRKRGVKKKKKKKKRGDWFRKAMKQKAQAEEP